MISIRSQSPRVGAKAVKEPRFEIRTKRGTHQVLRDGNPISRAYSCEYKALDALRRAEIEHRQSTRACMCCGTTFTSDGPGNRLCTPCRARDGDPVAV